MTIRFAISILTLWLGAFCMSAQTTGSDVPNIVESIEQSGLITISQPAGLQNRLYVAGRQNAQSSAERPGSPSTGQTVTGKSAHGFRVEVFADNNIRTAKKQASARKAKVQSRFPQYRTYLVFESPYWRVRMGDFASREAAQAALAEIRSAMPSIAGDLRVVRSSINK